MAIAAAAICAGRLVAFPTETVYGLGADALNPVAVKRVFVAKGRPANNPVIVHLAELAHVVELVADWPRCAQQLADRFWPGPLTLLLPRSARVPDEVTGGGENVGLRIPAHPVALALLRGANRPIAAPSANPSLRVSATTAEHVRHILDDRVDVILDGGPTPGGIESTVLDLTSSPPRILRPGLISLAQLQRVIGEVVMPAPAHHVSEDAPLAAPGQLPRHYAPRARLECHPTPNGAAARAMALASSGLSVGLMSPTPGVAQGPHGFVPQLHVSPMPADPACYAAQLYRTLHELDAAGVSVIVVELPPDQPEWIAVRDRLLRAATPESE